MVIKRLVEEVDELIIGIGSAQLSHTIDNPFTGGERVLMMKEALIEYEVDLSRVYIIPVPDIEMNHVWPRYVSLLTPPFDVVFSGNPLVKRLFMESGFTVRTPPFFNREVYSGKKIRRLMLESGDWEQYVPSSVVRVIKDIRGVERLIEICKSDEVFEGDGK